MLVEYTTRNGRMKVTIEGKTQTDIFEQLAQFQEVFENLECSRNGKKSDNVRFVVREDDDANKYYELKCFDVDKELYGAKLAFGQHKKGGTLFPRRQDKDGNWLPNNGWVKFNKTTGKEE
jgi:hypothetical protein